jgi:YfiH family protein
MLTADNLAKLPWLTHGFGQRESFGTGHAQYPVGITTVKQIHSARVVDACGRRGDRIEEGDALISQTPGLAIGVRTADCVPILLADARLRTIAAIHAGWRGTAAEIVASTVRQMVDAFGTRPQDLVAAVGPGIGGCCYEVGPEVARRFGKWRADLEHASEATKIDLAGINAVQLRRLGVTDIYRANECTFCLADRYHSYRRDKDEAGRMLSFLSI